LPGINEGHDTVEKELVKRGAGQMPRTKPPPRAQPQTARKGKEDNEDETHSDDDKVLGLRLDLNLDLVVTVKAKIHGDVTLSLL
jgi:hypothetical protein